VVKLQNGIPRMARHHVEGVEIRDTDLAEQVAPVDLRVSARHLKAARVVDGFHTTTRLTTGVGKVANALLFQRTATVRHAPFWAACVCPVDRQVKRRSPN
jgi:hypothetical protein